jgi:hypothetical protein
LFKNLNASNQNKEILSESKLERYLSSIKLLNSNLIKLRGDVAGHVRELSHCRAYVFNRINQVQKHNALCRDAGERTSLEEIIRKRILILNEKE